MIAKKYYDTLAYIYTLANKGVEVISKEMTTYAYKLIELLHNKNLNVYSLENDSIYIDVLLKDLNGYTIEVRQDIFYLYRLVDDSIKYSSKKEITYQDLKSLISKGEECILDYIDTTYHLRKYSPLKKRIQMDYHYLIRYPLNINTKTYVTMY